MRSALVFAIVVAACEAEHGERPPTASPTHIEPGPMPSTAFAETPRGDAPPGPFETRRIADDETPAPRPTSIAFSGRKIDLDLKNTDLHEVFRLLADVGHVNIVVGSEVTGAVTMKLKDVPWDQALDVIVRARGLDMSREGNVILVRATH